MAYPYVTDRSAKGFLIES